MRRGPGLCRVGREGGVRWGGLVVSLSVPAVGGGTFLEMRRDLRSATSMSGADGSSVLGGAWGLVRPSGRTEMSRRASVGRICVVQPVGRV